MHWQRIDRYHAKSDAGYTISFSERYPKVDGQGDWLYVAWGPLNADWRDRLKAHYAIGEKIPQPHERLGTFETAERARAACDEHFQHQGNEDEAA